MPDSEARALPDLDIDVLRTFVAVAEERSFTRAAQTVHRTPSAVSMQIKKLEEILDRPLFMRDSRSVHLTGDGEALMGYARRILKLNEEAVRHFRTPQIEGVLRVGAPDDFGTRRLPGILARFAQTHPAVQVNVTMEATTVLRGRMDRGELDVMIFTLAEHEVAPDGARVIASEPLAWAGLKGGCAYDRAPLPLAMADFDCAWREAAFSALDKAGIPHRIAYTSPHWAGQKAAILADLAIAPFAPSLIEPPMRRLDERHGLPPIGGYRIGLQCARDAGPAAAVFADHVVTGFADDQPAPALY
ncbi:MAG: LysR family transcriptional regulator [Pseudomonadota bacterium]